jgi:hypothetical protein
MILHHEESVSDTCTVDPLLRSPNVESVVIARFSPSLVEGFDLLYFVSNLDETGRDFVTARVANSAPALRVESCVIVDCDGPTNL